MKKFILFIFLSVIICGCNKKVEHSPPTTFTLSIKTNNRYFDQHKLTITSIYLLDSSGNPTPLLNKPQTIDFGTQNEIINFTVKEITPSEYTKMLINIDATDAQVIQTQVDDKGAIKENTYRLSLIATTSDNPPTSEITLSIRHPFDIKPYSNNHFLLFYDASQSIALPKDASDTQSLIFSPTLRLYNLSDEGQEYDKEKNTTENKTNSIGKIYAFTKDTLSVKINDDIKNIDLNNVKLISQVDDTFPVTHNNIHIGQYVNFQEENNQLFLMPSVIIAEIPNLPDSVRHFPFDTFSINDLSFKGLFNTQSLDIDFLYLKNMSLSNLNEALIAFEGYMDTTEEVTFKAFDYHLIPFDAVNVAMTFNNDSKAISLHEETSGDYVFSLTGDSLSSAITFMTLKGIDVPLEKTIKKINILRNSTHTIKHLNNSGSDLFTINTSALHQALQDKFNAESHLSSLHIKGKFDYQTHTLIAESTTFMFTQKTETQGTTNFTAEMTISEDIKTSVVVAASTLAVGIFSIAVVVSIFAHKTGHVRDNFFKKFEGIDDETLKKLAVNIKNFTETANETLIKTNEDFPTIIQSIKKVGDLAEDVEGHGIRFGGIGRNKKK